MNKDIEIMDMPSGTKIKNKRNGVIYTLGEWVNQVARKIINEKVLVEPFKTDYINRNVQYDYKILNNEEE